MRAKGKLIRSAMAGAVALATTVTMTAQAQAQDLIDFLWGGGEEWGGGRQTVSFDPQYRAGQIIVSFGDRRLYLISKAGTALSYPIAVPREQSRWQGKITVTAKRENPSWTPTPEMIRENPKLPSWVPGGHPMNPLGVRALYLGSSTYRIHGTDAPWTIGQAVSKGCIRMFNEDVLDLYPRVPVGMRVTVTWERFKTRPTNAEVSGIETEKASQASQQGIEPEAKEEIRPVTEAKADDATALIEEPVTTEKPVVAEKRAPAPKTTGIEENYDDGYVVDNSSGNRRVTKIGRKPLVTRTSASAE